MTYIANCETIQMSRRAYSDLVLNHVVFQFVQGHGV